MADDLPYWESRRGEIVKWAELDYANQSLRWHEGPITNADDALEVEHYVVKLDTREGPRYYTVHYGPSDDFPIDWEIDRILAEYSEDFS